MWATIAPAVLIVVALCSYGSVAAHTRTPTLSSSPTPSPTDDGSSSSSLTMTSEPTSTPTRPTPSPTITRVKYSTELTATMTQTSSSSPTTSRTSSSEHSLSKASMSDSESFSVSKSTTRDSSFSWSGTPTSEPSFTLRSATTSLSVSPTKDSTTSRTPSISRTVTRATMSSEDSASWTSSHSRPTLTPTPRPSLSRWTASESKSASDGQRSRSVSLTVSRSASTSSSFSKEKSVSHSPTLSNEPSASKPTPTTTLTTSLTLAVSPSQLSQSPSATAPQSNTDTNSPSQSLSEGYPSSSRTEDFTSTRTMSSSRRPARLVSATVLLTNTKSPRLSMSRSGSDGTPSMAQSLSRSWTLSATMSESPAAGTSTHSAGTPTATATFEPSMTRTTIPTPTQSFSIVKMTKSATPSVTTSISPSQSSSRSPGTPSSSGASSESRSPSEFDSQTKTVFRRLSVTPLVPVTSTESPSGSPDDSYSKSLSATLSSTISVSVSASETQSTSATPEPSISKTPSLSSSREQSVSLSQTLSPSVTLSRLTRTVNHVSPSNSSSSSLSRDLSLSVSASPDQASRSPSSSTSLSNEPQTPSKTVTISLLSLTRVRSRFSASPSNSAEPSFSRTSSVSLTRNSPTEELSLSKSLTPSSSESLSPSMTQSNSREVTTSLSSSSSQSYTLTPTMTQEATLTYRSGSPSSDVASRTNTVTIKATKSRGPKTKSAVLVTTRSGLTSTPTLTPDDTISPSLGTITGAMSYSPTLTNLWSLSAKSGSLTQTLTMTETATRRRTFSRNPSSTKFSGTISTSGPTNTAEVTSEKTRTWTLGSFSKSPYSKTKTPNSRTMTKTLTETIFADSPTVTMSVSQESSVSTSRNSQSKELTASRTASSSPSDSLTLSESKSESISYSDTITQLLRSMSHTESLSNEIMSTSFTSTTSRSNPSASHSATNVATVTIVSVSPSVTDSKELSDSSSFSPTPEITRSASLTLSSTQTSSDSASKSLASATKEGSSSITATPSPSAEPSESITDSTPPSLSRSATPSPSPTRSSSFQPTTSRSASHERSASPVTASSSPSKSSSPSSDKNTHTPTPSEMTSVSHTPTPPPSASRRVTPTASGDGSTSTVTLRPSVEVSSSKSMTLTLTASLTNTRLSSHTHSVVIGSRTSSPTEDDTATKTLAATVTTSQTFATISLLLTRSLSLTPTAASKTPVVRGLTASQSFSKEVSVAIVSSTNTHTTTEDDTRTKTLSITLTRQTPSPTQTLLLTVDVTSSLTLALSDSARVNATRSGLLTASSTVSDMRTETRTLTEPLFSHSKSDSMTYTVTNSLNRFTISNSTTDDITSTRTLTNTFTLTPTLGAGTVSRMTSNLSTQTLVHTATSLLTSEMTTTRSATDTLSGDGESASRSSSHSVTATMTETPSVTNDPSSSSTKQVSINTAALSSTRPSRSGTVTISDHVTESLTLLATPTHTGTTDLTLTETPSVTTIHSVSVSASKTHFPTPSATRTRTVQSFSSAIPKVISPNITVVRDIIVIAFLRAPTTFSSTQDLVFIVLHNDTNTVTSTRNSCAGKAANATLLSTRRFQFISANLSANGTNVSLFYQGSSAVRGRYDLCHYSAARNEWSWWDFQLNLQVKFRPTTYLSPKGRLVVNNSFRLSIGVYGASAQDHMVLLLRSAAFAAGMTLSSAFCPVTAPYVPGASTGFSTTVIALMSSNAAATNATFASTGSVLTSGDYVLCYFGFPYTSYRVGNPLVRIAGFPESLTSAVLGPSVTAFSTFRITITGFGLSTLDPFLVANGSSCDSVRVPSSLTPRRMISVAPTPNVASLTSVVSDIRIQYPVDIATICVKSNVSTYYQPMRTVRVLDNTAVSISPNNSVSSPTPGQPLEYAVGATIEFRDVVPIANGSLAQISGVDSLVMCLGNVSSCVCAQDGVTPQQSFTPSFSSTWRQITWVLRGASLSPTATATTLTEVWSLCYLTNSSRSWRVTPLQQITMRRYINEPQTIPATSVQSTVAISLHSFNVTVANVQVRLFAQGTSVKGCPAASALSSSAAGLVVRNYTSAGDVLALVTPQLVQPMELCVYDSTTNVTFVASTITVVPTPPSLYTPTRFVVNVSTEVLFLPNDGSVFNFATTPATVALCPNNSATMNIRMFVDGVVNSSALRLRFTNVTYSISSSLLASNALCFFDPRNGSYIPISQGGNTFAVTSKVTSTTFPATLTSALRNVALVVPTSAASSSASSYVTLSIQGISLYDGDLTLSTCSSSPAVSFTHLQTSKTTSSLLYDIVTQVWRVRSTVSGAITLCASFGASTSVALTEGTTTTTPITVIFDSLMLSAQQLPAVPQSALIDHDNAYWLVAPTVNDSNPSFTAVRVVQYLATLDDQCTNPVFADLALSTTAAQTSAGTAVWRFTAATTAFTRGNVTLCYQSQSQKWYAYQDGTVQAFFMQASVLPSTTVYSDVSSTLRSQAFATCPTSVAFSGYQLDATRDAFYYYVSSNANPTEATEVCPTSGVALTISAVARDTTDILRLVNISALISVPQIAKIVICARLGDSSRSNPAVNPTIVAILSVTNPLNVTLLNSGVSFANNQSVIGLKCISSSVLAAPSVVRYNYSIRFFGSTAFMPLEVPQSTSSLVLSFTPQVPILVRYTAFLLSSGATLMTMDSDTYVSIGLAPATLTGKLAYCSSFNSSNTGLTASSSTKASLATYAILMINFATTNCAPLILDGTVSASHSAVSTAAATQSLIDQDSTLVWDGSYLYSLLAATYTSLLSADSGNGISTAAVTSAFLSLLSVTDPLAEIQLGANATDVVESQLTLLNAVSTFVSTSTTSSDSGSAAVALAPAVMQRLFLLSEISCSITSASGATTSFTAGSMSLSTQRPLTRSTSASMSVGSSIQVNVPRQDSSSASPSSGCVSGVRAPNFVPSGTSSTQLRRQSSLASGYFNTDFNLSTVVLFSDSPINNAAITMRNLNYARVDSLHPFRFFGANRSSPELTTTAGGTWDAVAQSAAPYTYSASAGTLFVNVTTTPATVAHYFVFSGIAEAIFPDEVLLKREAAMKVVAESLYWILLAVFLVHIAAFICGAVFDRFTAAQRYRETSDLLFGSPSPQPRWFQIHRYACMFAHNPISMTPKEYLQVRYSNIRPGDAAVVTDPAAVALQELTLHPLALLSTPAKVNCVAMYCYCLLLVTAFANRDNVARQIPFLLDDSVLLAGTAAILARPFATWTRIAQSRLSHDVPSLVAATLSIVIAIIAGGASSLSAEAIIVTMIVVGVFTYGGLVFMMHYRGAGPTAVVISAKEELRRKKKAAAKAARALKDNKVTVRSLRWYKSWSLHHLIHVPVPIHVVGLVLLFVAWLLCIVLIFFVPYFSQKYPIFTYQPSDSTQTSSASFAYFGRGDPYNAPADQFNPDTTIAWKTFVIALALDILFLEFLATGSLVAWMQSVVWWRISRFTGPTTGEKLASMGSMTAAGQAHSRSEPPTGRRSSHAPNDEDDLEEVDGDFHFVDVFSGSPVYENAEEYTDNSQFNSATKSKSTTLGDSATPRWSKSFMDNKTTPYATPTTHFPSPQRNAKTIFYANESPRGGGLIEEVTDDEAGWDEDMFASIDEYPVVASPPPAAMRIASPFHASAISEASPVDSSMFAEMDVDAFGVEVTSEAGSDADAMGPAKPVPPSSNKKRVGIGRAFRPPTAAAVGPDAAMKPDHNPFGSRDAWNHASAPRPSTRKDQASRFNLGRLQRSDEVHEDPFAVFEAASTQSTE
ncbi:membrane-associated protein, putative [Bodo saltans]|uniref:Membrane-associated protein, putative n=1 Tax=Bodo saltans TaxID=75058 RepID=A0A0S4JJT2_BODSA|nr:membrane-associated protein, putative [Bodo saltans]|eukprot:CUG90351.1 membrane-associated protein, putative [Bodo saltans]